MIIAKRLDHIILETDDILRDHSRHCVAWPIGPFWPDALTSGVDVGGFNIEYFEPLNRLADLSRLVLVFEPAKKQSKEGWTEKIESDPALLRMRGFSPEESKTPQLICRNSPIFETPIPHFFCEYAPSLKRRISPDGIRCIIGQNLRQIALDVREVPLNLLVPQIEWRQSVPAENPTTFIRDYLQLFHGNKMH